jgi:predicted alpha/beta superfamily hydrolase
MIHRILAFLVLTTAFCNAAADELIVIGPAQSLHSAVLNEDRSYRVYLPPSYRWAKDRSYPVLYLLDGREQFVHTAAAVDYLATYGEIPEMIVVGVDSTVRVRDFTQSDWSSHWVGGGGASNFKRFLSTELIPNVERTYRANEFRALSGHSAGGQFALYCLTSEPSLFHAYMALSPSLDWDDNLPQRSLEKAFMGEHELKAFLYVARSDDSGRPLADYERLVETLKTKSPRGFRWFSQPFPDETHMGMPLLAQIDALRHLYDGYRWHDMDDKGLAFAEERFRELSEKVGWPIPIPESVLNSLGYAALSANKTSDAIALFARNVKENPNSASACDSLSEGYEAAGMWKEAAKASDQAAALANQYDDPNRRYFVEQARKRNDRLKQEKAQ